MRTARTIGDVRAALSGARRPVVLVPTMGALHEGHLSLIRHAGTRGGTVVVSVFVNPAQFGDAADLATYPRDDGRDAALAREAGAHLLFAPAVEEMYPEGFVTSVEVDGPLTSELEGHPGLRGPGHFRGVTTVVAKLLNIVGPDIAVFGQKDAQQAVVVRRMVRDLDFPVAVETLPTVRDADGLALSSRNTRLSPEERVRALALSRALRASEARAADGELDAPGLLAAARAELDTAGVALEYLELRSPTDLSPLARVDGAALLCVAARVGSTRLIDNLVLRAPAEIPSDPLHLTGAVP